MNYRDKLSLYKKMYVKFNCYLLVYERQINHSHLDIPQVSFHTEQRDPAAINSALSTFHCRSLTSGIYCDFVCLVLTCFPPKLRCNEFKRGHSALKEQYPVTALVPNFDFLTGCRQFKRREESKRTLKNQFGSRLAEFDTTAKTSQNS